MCECQCQCYDRHETEDRIEIVFHHLPWLDIALGAAAALAVLSRGRWTDLSFSALGLLVIAWVAGMWEPITEIQRAMDAGTVEVSGSKFSFCRPLRVVIKKPPQPV